jgi:DNA polymerase
VAAQDLLESDEPLGRLRTRVHRFPEADIPVVVTYHPAYLLRSPAQKRKAWQDLCRARDLLAGSAA